MKSINIIENTEQISNIIISKNNKIEFIINRSRLVLGNKCVRLYLEILNFITERIKSIKEDRKEKIG